VLDECDGIRLDRIRYEVSSLGEIRNVRDNRPLYPCRVTESGHLVVNLTIPNSTVRRLFLLRRLIAAAFSPRPEGWSWSWIVRSRDEDRLNVRADNLVWAPDMRPLRELPEPTPALTDTEVDQLLEGLSLGE
jgi:hypothetical protein